jgi:hypothetical protein
MGLFAFNARFGTVPLPLGAFGDRLTNAFGDRLLGYSEVGWAGLFGGLRETVPFWGRQDVQWLHRLQLGAVEALV